VRPATGNGSTTEVAATWARVILLRAAERRGHLIAGGICLALVAAAAWWVAGLQAAIGIGLMALAAVVVAPSRRRRVSMRGLRARTPRGGAASRGELTAGGDPPAVTGRPALEAGAVSGTVLDRGEAALRGAVAAVRGVPTAARVLRPLERAGYTVLHDRAAPRGRTSIDHLVIGPVGVIVIDSTNAGRRTTVRDGDDGRVWIGDHPADQIVTPLTHEAQRVSHTLGKALGRRVPVISLVTVDGAGMPRWRDVTVNGVTMLRSARARRWISKLPKRLAPEEVGTLARSADRLFPPVPQRDNVGSGII
jgi:hypothetical protein